LSLPKALSIWRANCRLRRTCSGFECGRASAWLSDLPSRYQLPEKLIPLLIHNALAGEALPVYGDGKNVRDWLYVEDHCNALGALRERGAAGETYNIGGNSEKTNLEVVEAVCGLLDELHPRATGRYRDLVTHVKDRPGHDRRYAMDASKMRRRLGWQPAESFATGLRKTVRWYLDNAEWVRQATSGGYKDWVRKNYTARS